MKKVNKKSFTLYLDSENGLWHEENNVDGTREVHEFCVKKPDNKVELDARIIYNREYRDLISKGTLLRVEVEKILKERGLWDDNKEQEFKSLNKKISDFRAKLSSGTVNKKQAYELCLEIIKLTNKLNEVNIDRNVMSSQTAESQADNAKFNYYISSCTFDNEGNKYFSSYEELLSNENDNMSTFAGMYLMELLFKTTEFRKQLPEYKFLLKYGYCDDELRLMDFEKKNYITLDGKVIDKDGYFVNEGGVRVDEYGNKVVDVNNVEFAD